MGKQPQLKHSVKKGKSCRNQTDIFSNWYFNIQVNGYSNNHITSSLLCKLMTVNFCLFNTQVPLEYVDGYFIWKFNTGRIKMKPSQLMSW